MPFLSLLASLLPAAFPVMDMTIVMALFVVIAFSIIFFIILAIMVAFFDCLASARTGVE